MTTMSTATNINNLTYKGWLKFASDTNKFVAVFTSTEDKCKAYIFNGKINETIPAFQSSSTELDFNNTDQLKSEKGRQIDSGVVGKTHFHFELDNGPKISGNLDTAVNVIVKVTGSGFWTIID
ncbi:hypothetical protein OBBRIDRAFT_294356 [Obba rivulosa]|uniref:Uncharacterized protein n=1 Tax=Obba rivulosa TaxID=1052685 RepID=A0A8E2AJE5_9APHY|nr:hypothetical protein OBBRIDRAFT_294356 [Obba rivulosa]